MVLRISEHDLDAFSWLAIERWTVDNLCGPILNEKIFCKLCDKYILMKESEEHVAKHVTQRNKLLKKRRKEAAKKRQEALRLAREAKMEAQNVI